MRRLKTTKPISIMEKLNIRLECINPVLNVKDLNISRGYYLNVLGFEEEEWGKDAVDFTCISRDGFCIYLCQGDQGQAGTWLWVGFDGDIHALHKALKANGAIMTEEPVNYPWAFEMLVEDPDGHVLRFGTGPSSDLPFAGQ